MTGKIRLELQAGGGSKVFIDDKEIHGVTSIKVEQTIDTTVPTAEIRVRCKEVEVDTKGLVEYVDESVNDKTVDCWLKKNCPGISAKYLKEYAERSKVEIDASNLYY